MKSKHILLFLALVNATVLYGTTPLEDLLTQANSGNKTAQVSLGIKYKQGDAVAVNYIEAMRWFRRAADQGDARAQYNIAVMYQNGEGVPKNYVESVKWLRQAADQGLADAEILLSTAYMVGLGVDQDPVIGLQWLRKAADQGDATALALAKYATTRYSKMAEQGDAKAKQLLDILIQSKLPVANESTAAPIPSPPPDSVKSVTIGSPQAELKTAILDIARLVKLGEVGEIAKTYTPPDVLKQKPVLANNKSLEQLAQDPVLAKNPQFPQILQQLRQQLDVEAKAWEALADQMPTYNKSGDEATYIKARATGSS